MLGLWRYTNEFSKGRLNQILLAMAAPATSFRRRLTESKDARSKARSQWWGHKSRAQVSLGEGVRVHPQCQELAAIHAPG